MADSQPSEVPPPLIEPEQDDLDDAASVASEDSVHPALPPTDVGRAEELCFLFNPVSKVAHVACKCDSSDKAFCYETADAQHWRTCCGARPNAVSGDLVFTGELPAGARVCLRNACAKAIAHTE